MKKHFFIFIVLSAMVSCKPEVTPGSPYTFNKPGGAPNLPTMASAIMLTTPASSPNYIAAPTLLVNGVISGETVKVYTNSTCTNQVASAVANSTNVTMTTSALPVGTYSFYTKSFNRFTSTACSSALASYQYLGIQPTTATSMTLQTPSTSPGVIATPTILLSGVVSGETIRLFINNTCTQMYGSAVASGSSVTITTNQLAPGAHLFYTNTMNTAGTSTCSASLLTYQYTGVAPVNITSLALSEPTSSPNYDSTPTFLATGSSNGDTVRIYTDSGCTTLVGTGAATTSTVSITSSALSVATHSFYARSTNVIGSTTCSAVLATYQYLGAAPSVKVDWTANLEKAVNSPGGGYKVYYGRTANFDITTANVVDVPHAMGTTPTTMTISTLLIGTTYFKIVAYSSLNAPTSTSGSKSEPSAEFSVSLP